MENKQNITKSESEWNEEYALKLFETKVNSIEFAKRFNIPVDEVIKDLHDLGIVGDVYIGFEDPLLNISLLDLFFIAKRLGKLSQD